MLQDLVFIKYNKTLKERYESDNVIDPMVMDGIDTNSELLLGDELVKGETQSYLIFDGDDLSWLDVNIASGVAEPILYTKRKTTL